MSTRSTIATPPASNTGALTPLDVMIDWLAITFPDDVTLQGAKEVIALPLDGWAEMPHGGMGYNRICRQGCVSIYSDGRPGMGVHIEVSGQGCRELEAAGVVTDWQEWLSYLRLFGASFTRIDVAWDDRSGWLAWRDVELFWRGRLYTSRSRSSRLVESRRQGDPARDGGKTLYFGSAQSLVLVRIYDKAKEQGVPGHWLRVELQARSKRADVMASLIEHRGIGIAASVLHNYLDFKDAATSRLERSQTVDWWDAFLAGAGKACLALARVAKTLDAVFNWINRQVGPSLALITKREGGSIDWLIPVICAGAGRLTSRQLSLVPVVGG